LSVRSRRATARLVATVVTPVPPLALKTVVIFPKATGWSDSGGLRPAPDSLGRPPGPPPGRRDGEVLGGPGSHDRQESFGGKGRPPHDQGQVRSLLGEDPDTPHPGGVLAQVEEDDPGAGLDDPGHRLLVQPIGQDLEVQGQARLVGRLPEDAENDVAKTLVGRDQDTVKQGRASLRLYRTGAPAAPSRIQFRMYRSQSQSSGSPVGAPAAAGCPCPGCGGSPGPGAPSGPAGSSGSGRRSPGWGCPPGRGSCPRC
jgi:hypothetical protein